MTKEKILACLNKHEIYAIDYENVEIAMDTINQEEETLIDIDKIDTTDCMYFQAGYYSEMIGKTIILDHDVDIEYTADELEAFAENIINLENEAKTIESRLPNINLIAS